MKMEKLGKPDLSLLKKLLSEFEAQLEVATKIGSVASSKEEMQNYVIELSKAQGVVSGLVQEACLLVTDVQGMMKIVQQGQPSAKELDSLESLFGLKTVKRTANSGKN